MDDFLIILLALSPVWLLVGGGLIGRYLERRHFADIERRGAELRHLVVTDLRSLPPGISGARGEMVSGSMVVAADYFKAVTAVAPMRCASSVMRSTASRRARSCIFSNDFICPPISVLSVAAIALK